MPLLFIALTVIVALLHLYFMVLEMVLWTRPAGLRVFGQTPQQAEATKVLAANQGLYNGFLAAGLLFSLWLGDRPMQAFFLGCVVVAGVYGALTANRRILYVQALPAAMALVAWGLSGPL